MTLSQCSTALPLWGQTSLLPWKLQEEKIYTYTYISWFRAIEEVLPLLPRYIRFKVGTEHVRHAVVGGRKKNDLAPGNYQSQRGGVGLGVVLFVVLRTLRTLLNFGVLGGVLVKKRKVRRFRKEVCYVLYHDRWYSRGKNFMATICNPD